MPIDVLNLLCRVLNYIKKKEIKKIFLRRLLTISLVQPCDAKCPQNSQTHIMLHDFEHLFDHFADNRYFGVLDFIFVAIRSMFLITSLEM